MTGGTEATDVVAILQARTSSSRLPGKVLAPILGRPMILHQIERVRRARATSRLIIATSLDPSDDALAALLRAISVSVHRGPKDDVLSRFADALEAHAPNATHVIRLTGDCPFAEPSVIDEVVGRHIETNSDFTSNALVPSFPDGLDVEVVRADVLRIAAREARLPSEREHVMPFVWSRPERFKLTTVRSPVDLSHLRWTVDTQRDLTLVTAVFEALYPGNPNFGTTEILDLFARRPELSQLNAGQDRNEGYTTSLRDDDLTEQAGSPQLRQNEGRSLG